LQSVKLQKRSCESKIYGRRSLAHPTILVRTRLTLRKRGHGVA
jgi:hypothetical protein